MMYCQRQRSLKEMLHFQPLAFFFVMDLTRYAETTYANNIHFTLAIHAFHGIKFTFL